MAFNINDFRSDGLRLGGARPNQFEINIYPPFQSAAAPKIRMMARAASVPPMILGEVQVAYFGRFIKVNGDREFPDWQVTIYNDEDFKLRLLFENWSNRINTLISNRMDPSVYATGYKVGADVTQMGKDGRILRSYQFDGLWPKMVDAMPLDWAMTNSIQEFTVTFAYDWWTPSDQPVSSTEGDYSPTLPDDGVQG